MEETFPDILCRRCKAKIPTLNPLRKWCVDCRKELTNERARLRNKERRAEAGAQGRPTRVWEE